MNEKPTRLEGRSVQGAGSQRIIDHQRAMSGAGNGREQALGIGQPLRSHDQHQLALRQDRCALVSRDGAQLGRQRPDDEVAVAEDLVHRQRQLLSVRAQHHQGLALLDHSERPKPQQDAEVGHLDHLAAVLDLDALAPDPQQGLLRGQQALDRGERDAEELLGAAHHQDRRATELGHHREHEAGALAGPALDLQRAIEDRELATHDVQTEAAPRGGGDLRVGGEAGMKDELVQLVREQAADLGRAAQAASDCLLADALVVEAVAVVLDLDEDQVPALLDADDDGPLAVLAAGAAGLR